MAAASLSLVPRSQERSVAPLAQRSLFPGPLVLRDPQNAAAVQALSQRESEGQAAQNHALVARVGTLKNIVLAQQQENTLIQAESLGLLSRERELRLCFVHGIKAKMATFAELVNLIEQRTDQVMHGPRDLPLPTASAGPAEEDPMECFKRRAIIREVEAPYLETIKTLTQGMIELRENTEQLVEPMFAEIAHLEQRCGDLDRECNDLDHLVESNLAEIAHLKKECSDLNQFLVLEKETSKVREAVAQTKLARIQDELAHERRCSALKEQFAEEKLIQVKKDQEIVNALLQEKIVSQSQIIKNLSSQVVEVTAQRNQIAREQAAPEAARKESALQRESSPTKESSCVIS